MEYRRNTYTRIYTRLVHWRGCCQHNSKRCVSCELYYMSLTWCDLYTHAYILGGQIGRGVVSIFQSAAFHEYLSRARGWGRQGPAHFSLPKLCHVWDPNLNPPSICLCPKLDSEDPRHFSLPNFCHVQNPNLNPLQFISVASSRVRVPSAHVFQQPKLCQVWSNLNSAMCETLI